MECLTLCLLSKERKISQFTNYNFNSLANVYGIPVGVSNSGLYRLTGDKDNITNISSVLSFAETDFGIKNPKKVRKLYFGYKSTNILTLTVQVDKGTIESYEIPSTNGTENRCVVTIRHTQKGRYWIFKISNTAGCKFSLYSISALVYPITEGLTTL